MRLPLLIALAAVAALTPAAHGVDAGQGCTADVFATVGRDFVNDMTAEAHGGPWTVVGAREVRLTCGYEFGDPTCAASPFLTLTSPPDQSVAVVAPYLFEFFDFGPAMYAVSTVTWTDTEGSTFSRRVGCAMVYPGNEA